MPYNQVTHLVQDPAGERVMRHAFAGSINSRRRIPLMVGHNRRTESAVGLSESFTERPGGLHGTFKVRPGEEGDRVLEDCRDGYLAGFSIEFQPIHATRAADGVREIHIGRLLAVALTALPAYDGALFTGSEPDLEAGLAAMRRAEFRARYMPPPRPVVDLTPIVITNQWGNHRWLA